MKITDEQARTLGFVIFESLNYSHDPTVDCKIGRAAIAACAPILLGEPSAHEQAQSRVDLDEPDPDHPDRFDRTHYCLRKLLERRLRSLTAKPDAAVVAALDKAKEIGWVFAEGVDKQYEAKSLDDMAKIVAAVRQADKEAAQ